MPAHCRLVKRNVGRVEELSLERVCSLYVSLHFARTHGHPTQGEDRLLGRGLWGGMTAFVDEEQALGPLVE